MSVCPTCGEAVSSEQKFCRHCGEAVEDLDGIEGDEIHIHLRDKDQPIRCNRADYNQQGEWLKVQMKDGSSRLYPKDSIEYIAAPNPLSKLTAINLNEEIPKLEMMEVET